MCPIMTDFERVWAQKWAHRLPRGTRKLIRALAGRDQDSLFTPASFLYVKLLAPRRAAVLNEFHSVRARASGLGPSPRRARFDQANCPDVSSSILIRTRRTLFMALPCLFCFCCAPPANRTCASPNSIRARNGRDSRTQGSSGSCVSC